MKLIFANRNYSSWSLRPWLVLRHFGIPFDEELVLLNGEGWQENIRRKSPSGRVPVLVDGDVGVPETIAIIEYLNDKYPAKGIWPSNRVERAYARAAAAEMHGGFMALRDNAPMNLRASHPGKVDFDLVADDLKRVERIWGDLLSRSGGPYLFGSFNAADAMFAPVASRIRTYELPVSDVAQEYVEAIYALPAFQEWLAEAVKEPWVVEQDEIDILLAKRDAAGHA
ncbi:glutathione S-transferase family protein [Devosia sp.]|uniref:glutathione S-transferase family protein n=1 Tax=Devosia sp. TaxID=1871048 RepID=UPI001AD00720|nr:glutathione S-transferase family protein [Devosia sp.]MBN9308648.1 glutathione S-transferase family protein [Devosia sp.]